MLPDCLNPVGLVRELLWLAGRAAAALRMARNTTYEPW